MRISRRSVLIQAALSMASASLTTKANAETPNGSPRQHLEDLSDLKLYGDEEIGLLLYPEFTALDVVGPYHFLAGMMGARVHLITNQPDLNPVKSDLGLAVQPTCTFETCPERFTALIIPGGTTGTINAASDERTIEYVQRVGGQSRLVGSVCTGALILGAAGMLIGKKATSHWSMRNLLSQFGAVPVDQRVVHDGNTVTGAGVTAGMDLAISLVAMLRGKNYALASMLTAEYAPVPPFEGGTPYHTPQGVVSLVNSIMSEFVDKASELELRRPIP